MEACMYVFVCLIKYTGFLSEIGTKLRDWAVGQAGGSCYSRAALSSNDSKTLYMLLAHYVLSIMKKPSLYETREYC